MRPSRLDQLQLPVAGHLSVRVATPLTQLFKLDELQKNSPHLEWDQSQIVLWLLILFDILTRGGLCSALFGRETRVAIRGTALPLLCWLNF